MVLMVEWVLAEYVSINHSYDRTGKLPSQTAKANTPHHPQKQVKSLTKARSTSWSSETELSPFASDVEGPFAGPEVFSIKATMIVMVRVRQMLRARVRVSVRVNMMVGGYI